jgi:hypothetical protein
MAAPHVAGVAALIVSRYGDSSSPQNGKLRRGQLATVAPRSSVTAAPATTRGTGNGQADALAAVTHASGNY